MKAALCQFRIEFEEKSKNLQRAAGFVQKAAESDANIVFFPEMSFTGFSMQVPKTGETDSYTIGCMQKLAQQFQIAIGFGWVRLIGKNGEKGENHYTVVAPDGTISADYIKIHPFSYSGEDTCFEAGSKPVIFPFMGKKIALFICYDLRFPEIFRAVSKEAEIMVIAANWPEKRIFHWNKLLEARALENQSWVLGINCCGDQQGLHYNGSSRAVSPEGESLVSILEQEGLIFCEIHDEAAVFRQNFPVFQDRKDALYQTWYAGK